MSALEKSVYTADITVFFIYGVVVPLWFPKDSTTMVELVVTLVGNRPFYLILLLFLAAAVSGVLPYWLISATREQPKIVRLILKLFVLGLPAVTASYMVAIALGWFGLYEAGAEHRATLAVGAVLYICAGVGGITSILSTPEYKHIMSAEEQSTENVNNDISSGRVGA